MTIKKAIQKRTPSLKYFGTAATHYTVFYTAATINNWFITLTPFTIIATMTVSGQESKSTGFAEAIENKAENKITQNWLDNEKVEYETPTYRETILGR